MSRRFRIKERDRPMTITNAETNDAAETIQAQLDPSGAGSIDREIDGAIVGAGLAGLICAQQLQQWGYQVISLEKSRGLGGRLATRRLADTCADHGVRAMTGQGSLTQQLIATLVQREPNYYSAPAGLTTVAKFLAQGLSIWREQRVISIAPDVQGWRLQLESRDGLISSVPAKFLILAIPAPQASALLAAMPSPAAMVADLAWNRLRSQVQSVEFDPCITVIATYAAEYQTQLRQLPWQAVKFPDSEAVAWLSFETHKRSSSHLTPVVVQSHAEFARQYWDAADLKEVGYQLLAQTTRLLAGLDWLNQPSELQMHRWRYGFVRSGLDCSHVATTDPLPLVCCGDWCRDRDANLGDESSIEAALRSGLAAANQIRAWGNLPVEGSPDQQFGRLLRSIS